MAAQVDCEACAGSGEVVDENGDDMTCPECQGDGWIWDDEESEDADA